MNPSNRGRLDAPDREQVRRAAPEPTWQELLQRPGVLLLPLRAFLGITFIYAGIDKLANRAFLDKRSPSSIFVQLKAAQRFSPIHGVVAFASHHAVLFGVLIALGELAVGLGVLLGLWARVAALGGMFFALVFFLTVSWHTDPYYNGSDIVFMFAFTPIVLVGTAGVLSLDAYLAARERAFLGPRAKVPLSPQLAAQLSRRTLLRQARAAGMVAGAGLLVSAAGVWIGRRGAPPKYRTSGLNTAGDTSTTSAVDTTTPASSTTSTAPTGDTTTVGGTTAPTAATSSTAAPATVPLAGGGTLIGQASKVPVGSAASFALPSNGDPAFVVQPKAGTYRVFDATCTHDGCPVDFDPSQKLFVCPCHGAVFDGANGQVLQGPAQLPLQEVTVKLKSDGGLYVF